MAAADNDFLKLWLHFQFHFLCLSCVLVCVRAACAAYVMWCVFWVSLPQCVRLIRQTMTCNHDVVLKQMKSGFSSILRLWETQENCQFQWWESKLLNLNLEKCLLRPVSCSNNSVRTVLQMEAHAARHTAGRTLTYSPHYSLHGESDMSVIRQCNHW